MPKWAKARNPTDAPRLTPCCGRREKSQRGRLKIFLGAAPGVGKTYEMLSAAQARLREKVDAVVGVVETHGRAETEALTAGSGDHPAPDDRISGANADGDGPGCDPRPPSATGAGR